MNPISFVFVSVLIASSLALSKIWHLGDGLTLQIVKKAEINSQARSFLNQHQLDFTLNGFGLSLSNVLGRKAIQFGFTTPTQFTGREEKDEKGHNVLSVVMGYKMATIVTLIFAGMGGLVLKALGVAKIALVTAGILFIIKLFHKEHHHHQPEYLEVAHLPEQHAQEAGGAGYQPSGAENYYAYSNYVPSGMGMEGLAEGSNGSVAVGKRLDFTRRRSKTPLYTIHRYSTTLD